MINRNISVVIPAYNSETTISECLSAIKRQLLPPLEIIVVDDGSTDRTVALAKEDAMVIPNSRGKGAGGVRNTGAYAAKGDIIVFTDSDCIPPVSWLQKIADAFKEKEVGAVAGGYSRHEGKSFIGNFAYLELVRRRRGFSDYVETAVSNNFAVLTGLFRELGGFPEIFLEATVEDMIFSYRVNRIAKIRWLRDNGIGHHFHDTIRGYLRQQYRFGRDTVVAYKKFPELMTAKTHQGRLIYLETFIAGLTLCGLFRPWPWFALGICFLWFMNIPLFYDNFKKGGFKTAMKVFFLIPVRDFNMVLSVMGGILKLAGEPFQQRRHNLLKS